MRGRAAFLAALLLTVAALVAPVAMGVGEHSMAFDDARGDVRIYVGGEDVGSADATHPHVDLLAVWVANETRDDVEIGVRVAQWTDPYATTAAFERLLVVGFSYKNQSYVIVYADALALTRGCDEGQAVLGRSDNEDLAPWTAEECLEARPDPAQGSVHITLPKHLIRGGDGVAIQPGDRLANLFAAAWQYLPNGRVHDRAPDEGYGGDFRFTVGLHDGRGHLALAPVQPIRSSNGESTTMLFPMRLWNHGALDDTVLLGAIGVPPEWNVRLPAAVRVAAGQEVLVPVVLSMEFTHEHGATKTFRMVAESTAQEGDYAQTELGVHWLEIPQPSGHHPFLWLHSAPAEADVNVPHEAHGLRRAWFNGIEDDPRTTTDDGPVGGISFPPGSQTGWAFPLDPPLQLGLHLDHEPLEPPYLDTVILATAPAFQATLSATIYYCDPTGETPGVPSTQCGTTSQPGSRVPVFTGTSDTKVMSANSATNFLLGLTPNPDIGVIPYRPGGTLTLVVILEHDTPQSYYVYGNPPAARLAVDRSLLHLPLKEYHDPIDTAFVSVGSLTLETVGPSEKPLNAGRTAAFEFRVANTGDRAEQVRLELQGINTEWARIHGPAEIQVAPGASQSVLVAVEAPEGAQEGERAELFLIAQSADADHLMSLARFRASVMSIERLDVPDEAHRFAEAAGTGSSPFVSAVLAVGLLIGAAWVRPRHGKD